MATAQAPKTSAPQKPLNRLEQLLLEKIWGRVKPGLDAAAARAKASLLDALEGKPLLVIGGIVGAIDVFLLKGTKPMAPETRTMLEKVRAFAAEKLPAVIDKVLEPPKPISDKTRKLLAGIVTIAGMLGVYQAGKAASKA